MRIWLGAEIEEDVWDYYRVVRQEIEKPLNEFLGNHSYGEGIVKWAFIAIITPCKDPQYPEVTRYNKKAKEAEFRLAIDHQCFQESDASGRLALVLGALFRSLDLLATLNVPDFNLVQLREDVAQFCCDRNWVPAHPLAPKKNRKTGRKKVSDTESSARDPE